STRHINHRRNAMTPRGECDALAVIAAGGRNDARHIGSLALQPIGIDEAATHLERAGRRVVLVLDDHMRPQPLRGYRRGVRRRRRHRGADDLMRAFELGEVKHRHTSALPAAKAAAVASSLACSGSSISLCALPDGIIGKQFSSAATRQSNSTGRFTEIISLIAPSGTEGLIAQMPTQTSASERLTESGV